MKRIRLYISKIRNHYYAKIPDVIASKNKLSNLVCIVDNNNSQIRSLPVENLGKKFMSFGWEVWDIDVWKMPVKLL